MHFPNQEFSLYQGSLQRTIEHGGLGPKKGEAMARGRVPRARLMGGEAGRRLGLEWSTRDERGEVEGTQFAAACLLGPERDGVVRVGNPEGSVGVVVID